MKQNIKRYNGALKENIYPHIQECPLGFSLLLGLLERKSDSITVSWGGVGIREAIWEVCPNVSLCSWP